MTDEAEDNGLFAIEVDADDYAETSAGYTETIPRTFQSEADFQAQKTSCTPKIDGGNNLAQLLEAVPALKDDTPPHGSGNGVVKKVKLSKKDAQLLGYAIGEMYYERKYEEILRLCRRVREICEVDGKTGEGLERLVRRCGERLEE